MEELQRKNAVLKAIRQGKNLDFLIDKFTDFTVEELEDIVKESEELKRDVDEELRSFNLNLFNRVCK